MAISAELGPARSVELSSGPIAYREQGGGDPVLFVHGLLVNADLWRAVSPVVSAAGYRCIAPDWPLGAHEHPMAAAADLSPAGIVELIREFLDRLGLDTVTLIANDTGGALTQLFVARYPERVARVVLTPSDCFEYFFPPTFRPLQWVSRLPGSVWPIVQLLRSPTLQRLPIAFGWVAKHRIPEDIIRSYLGPSRRSGGVRRDVRKLLRGVDNRLTLAAVDHLRAFPGRVLLAWAEEDRLFPCALADRLAQVFPHAEVVLMPDSYTFVPEDQPARLGAAILDFLRPDEGADG
ncbi:MAG TPA: alpha/beta hydrolase [Acidimicrobiales bacterium]